MIDDPEHAEALKTLRGQLARWMRTSKDHCLEAFESRKDPAAMEAYVARKQAEADARRKKAPKKKSPKKPDPAQDTQRAKKRAEQRAKKKVDAQAVPAK